MMVACGRPSSSGQDDAGLPVAEVVGLQAGEDQVGRFGSERRGQQPRRRQRIERAQIFLFDVDGAVGALGERFANGLRGARRPGAQRDDFAAVLLLQLKAFFEGVGIRLVDFVARSSSSIHLADEAMRSCESRAGTCLMATTIFIELFDAPATQIRAAP